MPPILLQARRLTLRELQPLDLDAVHAYASDPRVVVHQAWGPNTIEQTRAFIDSCAAQALAAPRHFFNLGVALEGVGVIGVCSAALTDEGRQAEIGCSFNPAHWGKGYATEAVERLLDLLFSELGVHRVMATCGPENVASIALLRRARLRLEGRLLEHKLVRGAWRDSLLWSQLAHEHAATAPAPAPVPAATADANAVVDYVSTHPALTMLPQLVGEAPATPAQVMQRLLPLFAEGANVPWSAVLRPGESSQAQVDLWNALAHALTERVPNSAAQILEACAKVATEFNTNAEELLAQVGRLLFGTGCRFDVAHGLLALGVRESARRLSAAARALALTQMVG